MDPVTGRGSWQTPQHRNCGGEDDDDDDVSSSAPPPVAAAKENMNPEKPAKDLSKVAQTVASQLLCELALELD
jgi:hypothetical protein